MARPKHKVVATAAPAAPATHDPEVVLQELFSRELDKRVGHHADFATRAAAAVVLAQELFDDYQSHPDNDDDSSKRLP